MDIWQERRWQTVEDTMTRNDLSQLRRTDVSGRFFYNEWPHAVFDANKMDNWGRRVGSTTRDNREQWSRNGTRQHLAQIQLKLYYRSKDSAGIN